MSTGKACVLTSIECLKTLQEKKSEKKGIKAEEKEQRKQERPEKQLKEEQLKCKHKVKA